MFSKITVENFATFDHFDFDLIETKTNKKSKKLAIIYGENGIGKTCLIKCFVFLKRSFTSLVGMENFNNVFGTMKGVNSLDETLSAFLKSSIDQFKVAGYSQKYKKLNAKGDMKLFYEIILGKRKYSYQMVFGDKRINLEKLICDGDILFSCSTSKLDLRPGFLTDNGLEERIRTSFNMYFGENHTFLACLNQLRRNVEHKFFSKNISKNVINFLDFLDSIDIFSTSEEKEYLYYPHEKKDASFLQNVFEGSYNSALEKKLEKTKYALSLFFSSLYPNIEKVDYLINTDETGIQTYKLYFIEKNGQNLLNIPYELESTGTKKLTSLFTSFYKIINGNNVIVIDEIDTGINDILLENIFRSIEKSIKGQLIFTTHNTLLLKNSNKKYIYLLDRNEQNEVYSYSLDQFGRRIQSGTNVIKQYLKGLYGGIPQSGSFDMDYIVEALDEQN